MVRPISWRTRWRMYEFARNSLWIVPFAFVALAVALAFILPVVDAHTQFRIGISFGSDAARGVLGSIAGGMITFTGFVFSILLLAVQFGSSQFSPRMLRRFLRDPTTKAALGVFMATFVYALMVLRVVGTGEDEAFVPNNSISVALLLLLLSMLMFLRLLHRTTQRLRVAAVLADLGRDARRVVDRVYPEPAGSGEDETGGVAGDSAGDGVRRDHGTAGAVRTVPYRGDPGIVQSVDTRSLVEKARESDACVDLVPRFGELIAPDSALFRVHGDRGAIDDEWLRRTVAVGDERTMRQDPAFAFRLLADISAKALSPGVNDPTTAVQALDQIELLLRQVGGRRLTPGAGRDTGGAVRFRCRTPSWEDYLSLAVDETRHYGAGSMQVMRRLNALLDNVCAAVPEFRRASVVAEQELLHAAAGRDFSDHRDQLAALARDRQGLGATDVPDTAPPPAAVTMNQPPG